MHANEIPKPLIAGLRRQAKASLELPFIANARGSQIPECARIGATTPSNCPATGQPRPMKTRFSDWRPASVPSRLKVPITRLM